MIRALACLLLLTACAASPEPAFRFDRADRERLFVSPGGEPFRATPGSPPPLSRWFARADRDGDGSLTAAEHRADADRWFAVLAGNDGVIDGFEVGDYERERLPEMSPDAGRRPTPGAAGSDVIRLPDGPRREGPRRDDRGPVGLHGAAPYGLTGEPHPIMSADFDQSRSIDAAEFRRATDERFRLLDRAGDGRLTLQELEATEPGSAAVRPRRKAPIQIAPRGG